MKIIIPTLGRAGRVSTIKQIPENLKGHVRLVVQPQEEQEYRKHYGDWKFIVLPQEIKGISATREYIINRLRSEWEDIIIQMDDDISFNIRKNKDDWHLRTATPKEVGEGVKVMVQMLVKGGYAHVAISAREGNNRVKGDWAFNQRYMRCHGYNLKYFDDIEINRIDGMEDFDVSLQLLKKGRASAIYYRLAQVQRTSNDSGGCSTYRDLRWHSNNAKKLVEYHAPFAKLRKKKAKKAWGGGEFYDVTVQWKKAYEYGRQNA